MSRILSLDYGTKRIGVALSDETKKIAFARPFIEPAKKDEIIKLIKDNRVERVLLGLPTNLAGQETAAAAAARNFGGWLQKETSLPMEYIDERLTTKEVLKGSKGGKGRRGDVDSLVAQKMLQRYLDSRLRLPAAGRRE